MKVTTISVFIFFWTFANAQELVSFKLSECDTDSYIDLVRTRIVSKKIENDTLTLKIGFVENCCLNPIPVIESSTDTIRLSLGKLTETFCACNCCFEMELKLIGAKDTSFTLMKDGYLVKSQSKYPKLPHDYVIDKNTPKNQTNENNLKVGLWYEENTKSGNTYEIYYDLNPTEKSKIIWFRTYDKEGKLLEISVTRGKNGDRIVFDPKQYSRAFE